MRHNLWEILSGWGRRSGLRQLNSGKIYRKVGRADCRNDFSNTLWYAEAFSPVQSDSQTSEWYIYFENDVPNTKKACRNICRVELIGYIWSINECLIISYIKSSEMDHHLRALILHSFIQKSTVLSSSSIQTVLSAPESHRIMPFGSRALPPVGNHTLPWRYLFVYFNTLSVICKAEFLFYLVYIAVTSIIIS